MVRLTYNTDYAIAKVDTPVFSKIENLRDELKLFTLFSENTPSQIEYGLLDPSVGTQLAFTLWILSLLIFLHYLS